MMKVIKISAVWCPACILSNKIWRNVKVDYPDIEMEELDFDFDEEEVKKLDVGEILPVVIFMDEDQEKERLIGEKSKEEIYEAIERNR